MFNSFYQNLKDFLSDFLKICTKTLSESRRFTPEFAYQTYFFKECLETILKELLRKSLPAISSGVISKTFPRIHPKDCCSNRPSSTNNYTQSRNNSFRSSSECHPTTSKQGTSSRFPLGISLRVASNLPPEIYSRNVSDFSKDVSKILKQFIRKFNILLQECIPRVLQTIFLKYLPICHIYKNSSIKIRH